MPGARHLGVDPDSLRFGGRLPNAEDNVSTTHQSRFALLTIVSSLTLAEMSDKTSLATLNLASDHNRAGVWIGSTLGMVLADGLAIGIGTWLHQRLPTQLLHVLAGLPFLVFGLWILSDGALGWRSVAITVATAVAQAAAIAAMIHRSQTSRRHRTRAATAGRSPGVV